MEYNAAKTVFFSQLVHTSVFWTYLLKYTSYVCVLAVILKRRDNSTSSMHIDVEIKEEFLI